MLSNIDLKAVAKELAIVAGVVLAADLGAALIGFSENPGAILDDPKSYAIAFGRTLLPKLVMALRVKGGELLARFMPSVA